MGKKLNAYILELQLLLDSGAEIEQLERQKQELLVEIGFWQHERLIHLMVTILFALLTMAVFILLLFYHSWGVLALLGALLVLMIPYIRHYFILENGVQTLYVFYEELTRREKADATSVIITPRLEGVVIRRPTNRKNSSSTAE